MATYLLVHGASSDSWYWHLVVPLLQQRGHRVVAPDLPVSSADAGLEQYAEAIVRAAEGHDGELVIVGQSLGGFPASLAAARLDTRLLVLTAAMVPKPHELLADWWENTRYPGRLGDDMVEVFFHDVPETVRAEALQRGEVPQSDRVFADEWPLDEWPAVPTRFLLCRDDRFFPADFMRETIRDRLGFEPDELASGHLPALAHPAELVERLEAYRVAL